MQEALQDIRQRLLAGEYQNEEHVRFSLVGRILYELGWNIWSPRQVFTEFKATVKEDHKRVDVALFTDNYLRDAIFIECKAPGRVNDDLERVEHQLRDYNRNLTALFTIITDGRYWRFYFSFAGGEFSEKLFRVLDLLETPTEELLELFRQFLGYEAVFHGDARAAATSYLQLTNRERTLRALLPEAEKLVANPPFPSLPDALVQLAKPKGLSINREEVTAFLTGSQPKPMGTSVAKEAPPIVVPKRSASAPPLNRPAPAPRKAEAGTPGQPAAPQSAATWFFRSSRGAFDAQATQAENGGFTVLSGSRASVTTQPSMAANAAKLRSQLIKSGTCQLKPEGLLFTQDVTFDTAKQAAGIVCGYAVNGLTAWRNSAGQTLGETLNATKSAS